MSLPGKRRQGDWKQASELSRDYSFKKKKKPTPKLYLISLNEIASFSEEHGGFQTFYVLRQQKGKTDTWDFHTIQGQNSLTPDVQHLRLEGLKSNLILLGDNCLTPSQMFSRREDLRSSAVTASHFPTGSQASELTQQGQCPTKVRSSVCVSWETA